jgi:tetratricopeptide (TPR) repeat protein
MKYIIWRGLIMSLGLVILNSCAKQAPPEIKWASSLDEALTTASEKNKPLIADFWSDGCTWCERLEDSTFTHHRVIELSDNMVFVKVEAKEDTLTRAKYQIAGFPTVLVMNSAGEEIDRIYGFLPADEFVETVQDYLQGKNTLADLARKFEEDPQDAELAFRLAEKYESRRMYEEANSYYNKVVDLDPKDEKGKSDDALFSLAWLRVRDKQYKEAIDAFKYFLQKFPRSEMANDAEAYIPYCYAYAGDTTKALKLYQKFLTQHPDSPDTGWVKGKIKELKGETE